MNLDASKPNDEINSELVVNVISVEGTGDFFFFHSSDASSTVILPGI